MEKDVRDLKEKMENIESKLSIVDNMEERLRNVESAQLQYTRTVEDVGHKVSRLDTKVDDKLTTIVDSNQHLRAVLDIQTEQNSKIMEKNNLIIEQVLAGNQKADERDDDIVREKDKLEAELKKIKAEASAKFWLTLVSSGGLITVVVMAILNIFGQ